MNVSLERQAEERAFIEGLRPQFENEGYSFELEPRGKLPEFMGAYRPDAIAIKGDTKIAVEVKIAQSQQSEFNVSKLRKLFADHPEWHLRVIYKNAAAPPVFHIPLSSPTIFTRRANEGRQLLAQGHIRAAFILSWGLLEAAFQMLQPASKNRALPTGTIIQSLAMDGHIHPDVEKRIRSLMPLRSAIVHGDLAAEPTREDTELIISTAEGIVREGEERAFR